LTTKEQIDRMAEFEDAKRRHSRIVDQIANGDCHLALDVFESESLDDVLDLQRQLLKMRVGTSGN